MLNKLLIKCKSASNIIIKVYMQRKYHFPFIRIRKNSRTWNWNTLCICWLLQFFLTLWSEVKTKSIEKNGCELSFSPQFRQHSFKQRMHSILFDRDGKNLPQPFEVVIHHFTISSLLSLAGMSSTTQRKRKNVPSTTTTWRTRSEDYRGKFETAPFEYKNSKRT